MYLVSTQIDKSRCLQLSLLYSSTVQLRGSRLTSYCSVISLNVSVQVSLNFEFNFDFTFDYTLFNLWINRFRSDACALHRDTNTKKKRHAPEPLLVALPAPT